MRLNPLGEELIIVDQLGQFSPAEAAEAIDACQLDGVIETAPAWDSVGIYFDPEVADMTSLTAVIQALEPCGTVKQGRSHVIPCCFEMGEDLAEVCRFLETNQESVIDTLTGRPWPIQFIGFQPGFPYCGPLPAPFNQVPRRTSPRLRVPAGSVAMAAGQLGIYPAESPGGWQILGRTPLKICSPEKGHFPLRPGDEIWLKIISASEFVQMEGGLL